MTKVDMSNWWTFDVECRMTREYRPNFYQKAVEFLCLVAQNVVTNEVKVWTKEDDLNEMFTFLFSADRLIAHNGRDFDIPALGFMFPMHDVALRTLPMVDTRWAAYRDPKKSPHGVYTYGDMKSYDKRHGHPVTKQLNALKAWGYRFGFNKLTTYDNYTDQDWANLQLTEELVTYCKVDVELNAKLFWHLMEKKGIKHAETITKD